MAEVDVKNRSSRQGEEGSQSGRGALERRGTGGGVSSRGGWDPFELNPIEFLNNPFTAMRRLSDEMDRSFGRMLSQGQSGGSGQRGVGWHPAIEVSERNGQLEVCAELPGLNPEDVKVEVTNDALVIHGEKKYEHEGKEGGTYHSERRYGQFYREIALPEGVDAEQAKANFRNGVLEVTVPVPHQATKRREIPIQSGTGTGGTATKGAGTAAAGASSGTTRTPSAGAGGGSGVGPSTQPSGQSASGSKSSGTTK